MAQESYMTLPLGSSVPDFSLPDVLTQKAVSGQDYADAPALLVVFLCRHCPYVVHIRKELVLIAEAYEKKGLSVLGISANDASQYPDDAPEKLAEMVRECGLPFPVLYDETQEVARKFQAACTPDFFLFGKEAGLFYRGRLDDSTPGNGKSLTGKDLRKAIDLLFAGENPPKEQMPSLGCSIKWK